jgi:hypothetical protein
VNHGVGTIRKRALEHGSVRDVPLDQVDGRVGVRLQIDHAHGRARIPQVCDDVAPDEARAAGDYDAAARERARLAHFIGKGSAAVLGSTFAVARQSTVGMIA